MSGTLKDANFATGAVRSADVDHLDFASMPLMGLLGVIAVAGNGGIKYGRFNYMKGMPVHATLNHVAIHLIRYILGDRTEDHLSKVAWGAMVANQTVATNPELAEPHMLGPGATLTGPMLAEMEQGKPERDAARQAGWFEALFNGTFADMPEVKAILGQRCQPVVTCELTTEQKQEIQDSLSKSRDISALDWGDDDDGFAVIPCGKPAPSPLPPAAAKPEHRETLREWCDRNPISSDLIVADDVGLSGTGCPEPFARSADKPRPSHSHSPLATRQQNRAPRAYRDGEALYFGSPPKPAYSTPGGYFPSCPPGPAGINESFDYTDRGGFYPRS